MLPYLRHLLMPGAVPAVSQISCRNDSDNCSWIGRHHRMNRIEEDLHSLTEGSNTIQGYKESNQSHRGHLLHGLSKSLTVTIPRCDSDSHGLQTTPAACRAECLCPDGGSGDDDNDGDGHQRSCFPKSGYQADAAFSFPPFHRFACTGHSVRV